MHEPVLLHETIATLDPRPGEFLVDGTLGLGGHSREILPRLSPGGTLLGLDLDPTRIGRVQESLDDDASRLGVTVETRHASYDTLPAILADIGRRADGLLLDLGFASDQLTADRGFSFREKGPLTMTYDPDAAPLADLLRESSEAEIARVLRDYGDERYWKRVSRSIHQRARAGEIRTTLDLREAIVSVMPRAQGHGGIDAATRSFQALRIWANGELDHLDAILAALPEIMAPGGRVAIISFHALEDSRVQRRFRELQKEHLGSGPKKFVTAGLDEVVRNPRSRSARLRSFTFFS